MKLENYLCTKNNKQSKMKRHFILPIIAGALTISAAAQIKETPLLKIGDDITSLEEFNYMYNKNNSAAQFPISRQEYYELFVNYKLKAAEGHALGLDTAKQYKNESQYYYNELSRPYLTDTIAQHNAEAAVKLRLEQEVDASHILVMVKNNATAADTLAAYNKLAAARQRIINGEDFATVAKEVSEDPSAQNNGGRLGYFTALQMIQQFEDMAFTMQPNTVSPIFRTRFGYHFIKLHDRRPFSGEMQTAHIMIMANEKDAAAVAKAKALIDSVYTLLTNGADFSEMAIKFSEDKQSGLRGGTMPWLTRNAIIPEYSEPAFNLKNNGDYTRPVQSRFGWHIIKRIDWRDKRPDEDLNKIISRAIQQGNSLVEAGSNALAEKLMKEYNFRWNKTSIDEATSIIMSAEDDSTKEAKLNNITSPIATFADQKIMPSKELLDMWNGTAIPYETYKTLAHIKVFDYMKSHLMQTNADFKYTMKEYYDGLLVYEVNKKLIWDRNDADSLTLYNLYQQNPSRYTAGATFNGTIYFCYSEKDAQKIEKLAAQSPEKAEAMAMRTIKGEQQQGGIYDEYIWPNIKSKYVVVYGEKTEGTTQPYNEVKGLLLNDYQQLKDAEKVNELRLKYKPKTLRKLN